MLTGGGESCVVSPVCKSRLLVTDVRRTLLFLTRVVFGAASWASSACGGSRDAAQSTWPSACTSQVLHADPVEPLP